MKMEEKMKKLMAENRKLKAMMKGPKRMAGGGKTSKYKAKDLVVVKCLWL